MGISPPCSSLLAGCLVSLVFAVTAARPRVHRTRVDVDDIRNNTGNLLFFAQFTSMSLPQFQECVHVLMKEPALLYDHLTRQLYHMGESLNRKYRYLQIAYSAFLTGIGLATVLFAFVYLTGGLNAPAAIGDRAKTPSPTIRVKIDAIEARLGGPRCSSRPDVTS